MTRYAIFYSPLDGDPLNEAASRWLGRDVFTGKLVERPSLVDGLSRLEFDSHLTSARRYGFHGTLKAPFELAEGKTIAELEEAMAAYCSTLEPFNLPQFKVGRLGLFFALLPGEMSKNLKALASSLVRDFDAFRAPISEADIARRNPEALSKSQRDNLLKWGYPHIFENFRFHMTLSNPVPQDWAPAFETALNQHFAPYLADSKSVSALSLFVEPERGAPFLVHRQFPIG